MLWVKCGAFNVRSTVSCHLKRIVIAVCRVFQTKLYKFSLKTVTKCWGEKAINWIANGKSEFETINRTYATENSFFLFNFFSYIFLRQNLTSVVHHHYDYCDTTHKIKKKEQKKNTQTSSQWGNEARNSLASNI